LQVDLVKVYLSSEIFNLKQAVHVSDRTLSSIEKAETNYEGLMRVWDKYKNDGRVNTMLERKQPRPPGPKTVIFLNLFWKPDHSSKRLAKYCMNFFGSKIVEIAVKSAEKNSKERFDILSRFDQQAFEHLHPPPKFKEGDRIILHSLKMGNNIIERGVTLLEPKRKAGME